MAVDREDQDRGRFNVNDGKNEKRKERKKEKKRKKMLSWKFLKRGISV